MGLALSAIGQIDHFDEQNLSRYVCYYFLLPPYLFIFLTPEN